MSSMPLVKSNIYFRNLYLISAIDHNEKFFIQRGYIFRRNRIRKFSKANPHGSI